MARRKRQSPLLIIAQSYLNQHMPDMAGARLKLHSLDGPPDAPRYVVTAEACHGCPCPYGVPVAVAANDKCPIYSCPWRHSVRLLMSRRGIVMHTSESDIHWT